MKPSGAVLCREFGFDLVKALGEFLARVFPHPPGLQGIVCPRVLKGQIAQPNMSDPALFRHALEPSQKDFGFSHAPILVRTIIHVKEKLS